jgi:hypothetical protein
MSEEKENRLIELLRQEKREKVAPKFEAWRQPARYKIAYGGRGAGAKSTSAVSLAVQKGE